MDPAAGKAGASGQDVKGGTMLTRLLIVCAAIFILPCAAAFAADCTVYQHRDFKGSKWRLLAGETLAGVKDPGINQTCSHANCTIHWQPSWNDQISSFEVAPGCRITLWQHIDHSRIPPRGHGASFRANKSYSYVGDSWNDQASLVECSCEKQAGSSTPPARETIGPRMEQNTDRPGSDYRRFELSGRRPGQCQSACEKDSGKCAAWTYVRPGVQGPRAVCYLKKPAPAPVRNNCCISGTPPETRPPFKPRPGDVARDPGVIAATRPRCKPGFVWREARPADYVCVPPEARDRTARENAAAAKRVDPNGAWGPHSCIQGFVWREAYEGDVVCVTPETRALVKEENRLGPGRTE
jgi:syncollin